MTIRFLADEDLQCDIIECLRSREPTIDILTHHHRERLAAGKSSAGLFI
ncbi:MAG: hypothetical protein HY235_03410 [Acidobacteria bacterium]|nr:hypothetical protein [Acidobacteriota bacterium]